MDQPASIGDQHPENTIDLHSTFMTQGAAKSLTRSEESIKQGLRRFLHELRAGTAKAAPRSVADLHSHRARTRDLAVLLDRVAGEHTT